MVRGDNMKRIPDAYYRVEIDFKNVNIYKLLKITLQIKKVTGITPTIKKVIKCI